LSSNLVRRAATATVVGDCLSRSGSEDGGSTAELVVEVEGGVSTALIIADNIGRGNVIHSRAAANSLRGVVGGGGAAFSSSGSNGTGVVGALDEGSVDTAVVRVGIIGGGSEATALAVSNTVGDSHATAAKISSVVGGGGSTAIGLVYISGEDSSVTAGLSRRVVLSVG
jgi:hypothetical protein